MTLDATKPSDTTNFVSELGEIGRETRAEVNALWTAISALGTVISFQDLAIAAAQAVLVTGTDVTAVGIEILNVTSDTVETLTAITGGSEGHIKFMVFNDSNLTLEHAAGLAGGTFFLNNDANDFDPEAGDVLALVNINGNTATAVSGYWRELFKTLKV